MTNGQTIIDRILLAELYHAYRRIEKSWSICLDIIEHDPHTHPRALEVVLCNVRTAEVCVTGLSETDDDDLRMFARDASALLSELCAVFTEFDTSSTDTYRRMRLAAHSLDEQMSVIKSQLGVPHAYLH